MTVSGLRIRWSLSRPAWASYCSGMTRAWRALQGLRSDSAVLGVAFSIAAGTAMMTYEVTEAVVLRPLPAENAGRLVFIRTQFDDAADRSTWGFPTGEQVAALGERVHELDGVAAVVAMDKIGVRAGGRVVQTAVASVTPNLFALMGAPFACGGARVVSDRPSGSDVVLSYRLATEQFGTAGSACGRTIMLGVSEFRVRGVLSPQFRWSYSYQIDAWVDVSEAEYSVSSSLQVLGRLREAGSLPALAGEIERVGKSIALESPGAGQRRVHTFFVVPYREFVIGGAMKVTWPVALLLPLVVVVAAGNVVLLETARMARRAPDLAIRHAMGQGCWSGALEELGELSTYSLVGCASGVATCVFLTPIVANAMPASVFRASDLSVTLNSVVVALATTGLVMLSALFPSVTAVRLAQSSLDVLTGNARLRFDSRMTHVQKWVLWVQAGAVFVGLQLALAAGVGLWLIRSQQLGFSPDGVLAYALSPPVVVGQARPDFADFADGVVNRVEGVEGVAAAAFATAFPLGGVESKLRLVGTAKGAAAPWVAGWRAVSPAYFRTLEIPLLAGRVFNASQRGGPVEVVINRSLAASINSGGPPVGEVLQVVGSHAQRVIGSDRVQVVGVVGDTVRRDLLPAAPEVYVPLYASPVYGGSLLVRVAARGTGLGDVERAISEANSTQPLERDDPTDLDRAVSEILALPRLFAGVVATTTLVVALLALYGTWASGVLLASRTAHSTGIRRALGATQLRVILELIGPLAAGTAASLAAGLVIVSWIMQLVPADLRVATSHLGTTQLVAAVLVAVSMFGAVLLPVALSLRREPAMLLRKQ